MQHTGSFAIHPVPDIAFWIAGSTGLLIGGMVLLPYWATAIVLLLVFLVLAILNIEWFLLVLLFTRPLFDLAAQRSAFDLGQTSSVQREHANLAAGATVVLIMVCLVYLSRRWQRVWQPAPTQVFAAFLCICFITVFVSEAKLVSLTHFFRLASILVLFLALVDIISTPKQANRYALAIMGSAVVPIALAALQAFRETGDQDTVGLNRVYGSCIHPNSFAYFLLAVLLLMLGFWPRRMNRVTRALYLLLFLAALIGLALTYTRGAWLAFACGLIVYSVAIRQKAVLLSCALFGMALAPFVSSRMESFWVADYHYNSGLSRLMIWEERIPLVLARPLLGHGIGSTAEVSEANSDFDLASHNDYLRVALETGFVGLACFLLLLASFARGAARVLSKARAPEERAMAAALLAAVVVYGVGSIGENLLTQLGFQWYLWSFAAIAYASVRRKTGDAR